MATTFHFDHSLPFTPQSAEETLKQIPAKPGVFALRGPRPEDAPYLTQTTDLRRRMRRLLDPPESQSKRLNLREKVARIEYCITGSVFESSLALYDATAALFGYAEARRRLKLHTPYFLRLTLDNEFPRVYTTNKLSKRGLAQMYGPFPSRLAAERFCDAALDLFKLRRCHEDLHPYPEHPGCIYGEMEKCIKPCKQACTTEQYAAETAAVKKFFDTRGESMIIEIGLAREEASSGMQFEKAAALHAQWQKVKSVQSLVDSIIRPVPQLRAIMVQKPTPNEDNPEAHPEEAALFLLEGGCLLGPQRLSTLGVRAVREQTNVGSSLFAQPLMLQAVPLEEPKADSSSESGTAITPTSPANSPEERATDAIAALEQKAAKPNDLALLSDHLSLLRRWYYRPEKQRTGEIFLPNDDGSWPIRRILRGAARMALGDPRPMAETNRDAANEAAKNIKTRILHEGRPDVERTIPVLPKTAHPHRKDRPER
ncbi:MAG: excinuclease ABC subunit C [Edaphobacter sp.]